MTDLAGGGCRWREGEPRKCLYGLELVLQDLVASVPSRIAGE